jgi:ribosomal protein S18 acetylase RimI-like enzyme
MAEPSADAGARPTETVIRRAGAADADALARVSARAWAATYPGIVPEPVLEKWIETAPANWRESLERAETEPRARAWAADRGGAVIGYATTAPGKDWWLPPPDGAGELTNLYLDPDEIGTGLGSRLYDHAAGDLRRRGYTPFVVWAFRDNLRAVRFYERKGLTIDVPDHDWVLGDVPCKIVRLRVDWPAASP